MIVPAVPSRTELIGLPLGDDLTISGPTLVTRTWLPTANRSCVPVLLIPGPLRRCVYTGAATVHRVP
jgi:hypothetical protein